MFVAHAAGMEPPDRLLKTLRLCSLFCVVMGCAVTAIAFADEARAPVWKQDALTVTDLNAHKIMTLFDDAPSNRQVLLRRAGDGHYYAEVSINGADPVRMILDTGATKVALSRRDARRIGLLPDALYFTAYGSSVAGRVRMAPLSIASMRLGGIELRNVDAVVLDAEEGPSLLGMSFLNRVADITIRGGDLMLTR